MRYEEIQSEFANICTNKYNIELKNIKEVINKLSKTKYKEWEDCGFNINHQFNVIYNNEYGNVSKKVLQSLLHLAVQTNSIKLAKHLLGRKSNINVLNQNGHSPITCALFFACSRDMLILLMENNADIDLIEKDGYTPFTRCIKYINSHSVQLDKNYFVRGTKILQIFIEHVVIKSYINKKSHLLLQFSFPEYLNTYWKNCTLEVTRMKFSRIGGDEVSFFDFIAVSDDDRLMLIYNKKIAKVLERGTYKTRFCIYSDLIEYKYKKALEKKNEILGNSELISNLSDINTEIALKNYEQNICG